MSSAQALLSVGRSPPRWVSAGQLVGRSAYAHLQVPEPTVSEAHALVSYRDRALVLLALRGDLRHDGRSTSAVALAPGVEVELAPGVLLRVHDARLPAYTLVVVDALGGRTALTAQRYVVLADGTLAAGAPPAPIADLWSDGPGWRLRARRPGARAVEVDVGEVVVGPHTLRIVDEDSGVPPTERPAEGAAAEGLEFRVLAGGDVHVARGRAVVRFSGEQARLLSALAERPGVAVPVVELAERVLGPRAAFLDQKPYQDAWKARVYRIRRKLWEASFPCDVVRRSAPPDGAAGPCLRLALGRFDRVVRVAPRG